MVSAKERERLSMMFDKAVSAIDRQKKAINRLLAVNLEMRAALLEIIDMPEVDNEENAEWIGAPQERARQALARVDDLLAAVQQEQRESQAEDDKTNHKEDKP
jgi:hypothetical protein